MRAAGETRRRGRCGRPARRGRGCRRSCRSSPRRRRESCVAQHREHLGDRRLGHRHRGGQQPQLEAVRWPVPATAWASSAGSSHRTNDVAMPTRSWPWRRATSSMRVGESLRHRCFRVFLEQGVQVACGAPGIEGTPDGRLADAVDHRRARRLHGGHLGQVFGQVPLQRAGHDHGRDRPAAGSDREVWAAPWPSRPARRSSGSPASSPRPASRSRRGPPRPARAPRRAGRRPWPAAALPPSAAAATASRRAAAAPSTPVPGSSSASTLNISRAVQRCRRRVQRIRQRGKGFVVRSAAADQGGPGRQVQPGRRQQVPAHRRG